MTAAFDFNKIDGRFGNGPARFARHRGTLALFSCGVFAVAGAHWRNPRAGDDRDQYW